MQRSVFLVFLVFASWMTHGQNLYITFSSTGQAAQIDSVTATNLRTNESITFPGNGTLILSANTGFSSAPDLDGMVTVFPNPFTGKVTLTTIFQKPQSVFLKVHNLFGQTVAQLMTEVQPGENEFAISVQAAGIYLVSLTTGMRTTSCKIICMDATHSVNNIQYLGLVNGRASSQPALKGLPMGYQLGYSIGDVVLYRCKSANNITILTDTVPKSKNHKVEFVACADPDGLNYPIVKIGDQTWMAENLSYLPAVSPGPDGSANKPYYYVYDYQGYNVREAKASINFAFYGVLYNLEAARISCPSGWHLPSDANWQKLVNYLAASPGGKMKETGTMHWSTPNYGGTNKTGYTALPGGYRNPNGTFTNMNNYALFWSSSEHGTENAWRYLLYYGDDQIGRHGFSQSYGFSVRCLSGSTPVVTTSDITAITANSANSGGNITSDGGEPVTARGVCWSDSPNPSITDSKTTDGVGNGMFTSILTGLEGAATYFVRAYATNEHGTSYGDQLSFTTRSNLPCDGTFTDLRDSHEYCYKDIGNQRWMIENMAYLPKVSRGGTGSVSAPYYYVYGYTGTDVSEAKSTSNYRVYGVLYNSEAAKSACPSGWYLATDSDWKILERSLGMSNSDAETFGWRSSGSVGGKLKETGTTHWKTPNMGANNSSGFSARPGGIRVSNGYGDLGLGAYFWAGSLRRHLLHDGDGVERTNFDMKDYGISVRCILGVVLPTVTTAAVTKITGTSATSGGNITADGGANIIARGVCWSVSHIPTVADSHTSDGTGAGIFVSEISNLRSNTGYFVRAYATNSLGTSYGNEVSFRTRPLLPTVITTPVSDITSTTASSGGNITNDGSASIISRGVCWAYDTEWPTTDHSKTMDGTGSGSYSSKLSNLISGNTRYYVRAYATNSSGTSYGSTVSFKTFGDNGTFTDTRDGLEYKYVTIGSQTWMSENLAYLPSVNPSSEGAQISPYYYVYGYNGVSNIEARKTANYTIYGVLYNWESAKTACPPGWRLPSDGDWKILEKHLLMNAGEANDLGWRNSGDVGGKLKETGNTHWNDPNTGATNDSEFSALPGGSRNTAGSFTDLGNLAYFWSLSESDATGAWSRGLYSNSTGVNRYSDIKSRGFSIRCLKD